MEEAKIRKEVLNAALAGLLHDVGKVEQRAKDDPWNLPDDVRDSGQQPVHAAWSVRMAGLVPDKYKQAAMAGGYHRQPELTPAQDNFLSKLVALADKLCAGEPSDVISEYKSQHPPQQLVSIFDHVTFGDHKRTEEHFLPLSPLSLNAVGEYTKSDKKPVANILKQYDDLRDEIEKALKQDSADDESYLEGILAAMQKYAWCVPSAFYHSIPDVSLYDHSRMTAALAVCMSGFDKEKIDELLEGVPKAFSDKTNTSEDPVALLVGGDISGVQDFIYTISSKGAARTLRGRSFYLQMLTEAVLRFLLDKLGLPYVNVIYSGGGHFYLLAPVSAKDEIEKVRKEISQILLDAHGVSLYLAVGCAQVPASGFKIGEFSKHWKEMHKQVNLAKQNRYAELKDDLYKSVFAVPDEGGNPDTTCSICGEDVRGTKKNISGWSDLDSEDKICSLCRSFYEQIGAELPDANFVALGFGGLVNKKAEALDVLGRFGVQVQFVQNSKGKVMFKDAKRVVIWALDDPKDGYPSCDLPAVHALRYAVNQTPRDSKNEILTFDDLQKELKKPDGGFKRLGVLRMDVDNLGDVFSKGFCYEESDITSLSRVSALSSQMSLFFEGWLKRICERHGRKGLIYTVYAGGDDVFLLGPWDQIPELALDISDEFVKYTNGKITISGGMAFISGKYPIYQAAEDAEEAEKLAKNNGRDSFAFLGVAWKWSAFKDLQKKQKRLIDMLDKKEDGSETPKALLHTIRNLAQMEENARKDKPNQPVWGAWMWMSAYQLTRAAERAEKKGEKELAQNLKSLREDLIKELPQWGKAARWAQLILRK